MTERIDKPWFGALPQRPVLSPRAWARILGPLAEMDFFLARPPLLTKGEKTIW